MREICILVFCVVCVVTMLGRAVSNKVLCVVPRKGVYEINHTGDIVWSFSWEDLGRHSHEPEILPSGNMVVILRNPHHILFSSTLEYAKICI